MKNNGRYLKTFAEQTKNLTDRTDLVYIGKDEKVKALNFPEECEVLSISEFIKKIEEIPDKTKEEIPDKTKEFDVDGIVVKINDGCISIGNEISVSVGGFNDLYYNYTTATRPHIGNYGNRSISFGKGGFSIYGDPEFHALLKYCSWEQWERIRNKLQELKVIS